MPDRIILPKDEETFLKKATQLFLEVAAEAIQQRGLFTVALSGGSTPKKLYAALADSYNRSRLNWTKSHFFWGDERMVPPNHPDSNYKLAADQMLSHVPVPSKNIHRISGEMDNAMVAAKD